MKEIVKVEEAKLKPIRDFLTAYFPARDPWEKYRNIGTRSPESKISELLSGAMGVLQGGGTPEQAMVDVKKEMEEWEASFRRYEAKMKAAR